MRDNPEEIGPKTHKNLDVWNNAMDLAIEVYSITSQFPKEELFGLVSQMRRAAVLAARLKLVPHIEALDRVDRVRQMLLGLVPFLKRTSLAPNA
jgi:hypothetical protein